MNRDSIKAWAQLLRLPNVFTALADVIAGALLALGRWPEGDEVLTLIRVCFASACLYSAGMVLNDFFDVEEDTRERPFRPIPSGRVSRRAAGITGFALLFVGLVFGWSWHFSADQQTASIVVISLALVIVAYDARIKHTILGPAAMGTCRFLNLLLGMSHFHVLGIVAYWLAALVGCYIAGVTYLAKGESNRGLKTEFFVGAVLVFLPCAILVSLVLYSLTFSRDLLSSRLMFVFLLTSWALIIGRFFVRAILRPEPAYLQKAVKACIFGLVGLDAIFAYAAVGPTGLLLLLLLVPSIILGRFIYST